MAALAKIDPKTVFTAQEWAALTRRSDLLGLGMVVHAWALIGLAVALVVWLPNPLTYILAVMVIGARQLGLAILMHEAAHGGLSRHQALNDAVGQWLCAAPVGADLAGYRPYHLKHHKFTEQPEDPDLGLSAPFPVSRASLWRKVIRDLTGQTFFKQRFGPLLAKRAPGTSAVVNGATGRFLLVNAGLALGCVAVGLWWVYPALWLVPLATWFPLVTRLRNIAEHACVHSAGDPFRQARTTKASWWERLLIAPYWVHFHAEHHLWMHLPAYRLEAAHRLLVAKGYGPRMVIAPSYSAVLAEAAPA